LRRTKEEAEVTRQKIIETGLVLFSEQGVTATSLVELANRAEVSRGAVYWHFKNKWEIFDALFSRYSGRIEELVGASHHEGESDPLGRLKELIEFIFVGVANREDFRNIFKIFLRESFLRLREETPKRIRDFLEKIEQDKIITLENAKRKGQLPSGFDAVAGARIVHVMIEGIAQDWLQNPQAYDLSREASRQAEAVIALLRHGYSSPAQ